MIIELIIDLKCIIDLIMRYLFE